jgi:hypothetical protein
MNRDVEAIVASYIQAAEGDHERALRLAISDALADLLEAERRTMNAARLISHGYARGNFGLMIFTEGLQRRGLRAERS